MIVDRVEVTATDDGARRSGRVRWDGGELELSIEVPSELACEDPDASPFVPATLLPAMRRGEDLEVDGPVSPTMLVGALEARELYLSWARDLHATELRAAEEREPARRSEAVGCFFSRGVDSTYSAARPRTHPDRLERLVFVDRLEPIHDERVRAEEIRRASATGEDLGLPLSIVTTNLRELTDPVVEDWEDMAGAGLACIATSLAGALGHVVIPPTDGSFTIGPCGTSPLLDPLFSTAAVRVHHDSVARGRVAKTIWLARERPDLVRRLKVCWLENRTDNCGRCPKCLVTMSALAAAGALDRAEEFPDEIDVDAIRAMRPRWVLGRLDLSDLAHALDPERHPDLLAAVLEALANYPRRGSSPLPESTPAFRRRHASLMVGLLRETGPWPPLEDHKEHPGVGLVRVLDPARGRHLYGVGSVPVGELVGELGSLRIDGGEGTVPLRVTPEGYLVTTEHPPSPAGSGPSARIRWTLAPLAWRDVGASAGDRARAVLRRARAAAGRTDSGPSGPMGYPLAWLYRDAAEGRLPLHSAIHPITHDQLLTTNAFEATDLGYGEPVLLGHLDARAPTTGSLGTRRPHLFWASRFGQSFRNG